ncbi:hypothetical protein DCC39_13710 [Pueribacillus theae]|uniref:N-terminal of MaoC-like dehydratase domain-containing protein n=1 Tax=Pueribacillus theae TaxID=2171751 RepID=A0A2U1JVN4_9BACI|nr:hypothetical protein [Pueribacillus theae]PWA09019.1 hypothetical protein DCC39_13710 [Pueribacillus theae]
MKAFNYDDHAVGDILHSKLAITKELYEAYADTLGLPFNPNEKVPPSIFQVYRPAYEALGGRIAQGTIHLKQKVEHFGDAFLGDEFNVEVKIVDKYNRKNRDYLIYEASFLKDGELVSRVTTTHLWAFSGRG